MDKDTLEKFEYYAQSLEGLNGDVQDLLNIILNDIKQEKELQRMKYPELDVIDPKMTTHGL